MKRCISLLLTVCLLATMAAVPALAEAGTYTGVGAGKNGEGSIEVSVTLDDAGVITDVEVTKNGDDAGISDPAVEGVPAAIVAANSLAVGMDGQRFTSETGIAMLDPWIAGPNYYSIWSAEQIDGIVANGLKVDVTGPAVGFLGHRGSIPSGVALPEAYDVLADAQERGGASTGDDDDGADDQASNAGDGSDGSSDGTGE